MVVTSCAENAGILQINQVSLSFSLRKVQNFFKVRNTHFTVYHNEAQNSQSRFVGASLKNLCSQRKIKTFKSHLASNVNKVPKVDKLGTLRASTYI